MAWDQGGFDDVGKVGKTGCSGRIVNVVNACHGRDVCHLGDTTIKDATAGFTKAHFKQEAWFEAPQPHHILELRRSPWSCGSCLLSVRWSPRSTRKHVFVLAFRALLLVRADQAGNEVYVSDVHAMKCTWAMFMRVCMHISAWRYICRHCQSACEEFHRNHNSQSNNSWDPHF